MPTYDFNDFKRACGKKSNVFVWKHAKENAAEFFNLKTEDRLLDFIHSDGLENLMFQDTETLRLEISDKGSIIDAYEFRTGNLLGYIGFYRSKITGNWIIKSFKLSRKMIFTIADTFDSALKLKNAGDKNG